MAETALTNSTWTDLGTKTVDTLMQLRGGSAYLRTGTAPGADAKTTGIEFKDGDKIIVPANVQAHFQGGSGSTVVIDVPFGA